MITNPAMGNPDQRDLEWEAKEHLVPDTPEEMACFERWQKLQPPIQNIHEGGVCPPMEHLLEWDRLKVASAEEKQGKFDWSALPKSQMSRKPATSKKRPYSRSELKQSLKHCTLCDGKGHTKSKCPNKGLY